MNLSTGDLYLQAIVMATDVVILIIFLILSIAKLSILKHNLKSPATITTTITITINLIAEVANFTIITSN